MTPNSKMVQYGLLVAGLVGYVSAECPNACSGHGDCGNFDMCNCWRNWMGNDCSERICPFGLAQVDTPKGDLDMSNSVDFASWSGSAWSGGDKVKYHPMYYTEGVSEKFPYMNQVTSGTEYIFDDAAHYYSECSNKGICDRATGMCECFEGYEGSGCQRASCPNQCSGHGTCESIRELAAKDNDNIYELWDRDITYGCDCDPGYYGADCSLRYCKYGVDPLYYDDEATIRTNSWNLEITSDTASAKGTFAVKFYDVFDEDYVTSPVEITSNQAADNTNLKTALLGLPNTVVEDIIYTHDMDSNNNLWRITFKTNPGKAKTPEIDTYLNGDYGTLSSTLKNLGTVTTNVWPGAISGEFRDYFYSRCEGVEISVTDISSTAAGFIGQAAEISDLSKTAQDGGSEEDKLKKCLGDANGESSDNVGIWNWDTGASSFEFGASNKQGYGVGQYPHAIKLVETTPANEYVGGIFYLTYWHADTAFDGEGASDSDSTDDGKFMLLSRLWKGDGASSASTKFYVYTTDVVVKMVYVTTAANNYVYNDAGDKDGFKLKGDLDGTFNSADKNDESPVYAYWTRFSTTIYTSYDTSCEYMNSYADDASGTYGDSTAAHLRYVYPCLSKGDYIMLPDGNWGDMNDATAPAADVNYLGTPAAAKDQNGHMDGTTTVASTATANNHAAETGTTEYSGHLYQIVKIWTAPWTSTTETTENRYRITVDKPIPWDGSNKFVGAVQTAFSFTTSTKHGINPIFKFDTETETMDGAKPTYFEYVSECSNKGICNTETGLCECFKGYTKADCGTQSAFAL